MARGGKHRPGDVGTIQRKRGRRAASARAEKAKRERARARERKVIGAFLPVAVRTAKQACDAGAGVSVTRTDDATGKASRFRWTQAVVEIPQTSVSVRLQKL